MDKYPHVCCHAVELYNVNVVLGPKNDINKETSGKFSDRMDEMEPLPYVVATDAPTLNFGADSDPKDAG